MPSTSNYKSIVLLLLDITSIQSYNTLIENAAERLQDNGALDIVILPKISKLNQLDQLLAEIYTLSTGITQRTNKSHLEISVLFNEHYAEIESPDWELIILDDNDSTAYDEFKYKDKQTVKVLNVYRSNREPIHLHLDEDESEESSHQVVAVGGTFDHFHDGHKILLTAAAFVSSTTVIVGVTDQELLASKKYQEFLQSYDYRVNRMVRFLKHIKPSLEVKPHAIRDVCGPTGYIENIDALIVSRETIKGGYYVNKTRKEKGFHELVLHVINVVGGEEEDGFQNKLSSTQLRKEQFELVQKGLTK
ncbi:hypothetical protein WICMUC_003102 [Wickerhamomyces mucosus]|uniref:Cytidyltransferase-like domain-containing protein n=1 Tax=Wickerhamomyces mucosus TaxID=1378264 RepID=A0A9P8TD31_9ASCO|nr:hypothetical protein WICMUC_003102 [Wickerhamomyces mucosus]